MKCPVDQTILTIADRQGIEIDFCPTCRGVWLDRGELDKLIERSNNYAPAREDRQFTERHDHDGDRNEHRDRYQQERRHYEDDEHRGPHGKHRKKESFLGDMFDF